MLSPWPQIVSSHAYTAQYSAKYRETFWGSPVRSLYTVLSSGTLSHKFHLPWHLETLSLVSLLRKSVKQHVGNPHIHTTLLPGSSLKTVSWNNCGACLTRFSSIRGHSPVLLLEMSETTVLYFVLSSTSLSWERKQNPSSSIMAQNGKFLGFF